MLFAAIYVPDFAVQALLRLQPEHMRLQAVAVLDGNPPLVQVMAANQQARIWGVEPGMTRVQAEACAGLVLLHRSEAQELAAHEALLDCAYSVSPRVEATAKDVIVADVAGLEQLFGAPPVIARELALRVAACGMEARVAIAANIESAIHAARGFSGATVISDGEEIARLGALPVEVLSP
jgi:nucleotidyltransferase/DNA polymerase involved in DNA repair